MHESERLNSLIVICLFYCRPLPLICGCFVICNFFISDKSKFKSAMGKFKVVSVSAPSKVREDAHKKVAWTSKPLVTSLGRVKP